MAAAVMHILILAHLSSILVLVCSYSPDEATMMVTSTKWDHEMDEDVAAMQKDRWFRFGHIGRGNNGGAATIAGHSIAAEDGDEAATAAASGGSDNAEEGGGGGATEGNSIATQHHYHHRHHRHHHTHHMHQHKHTPREEHKQQAVCGIDILSHLHDPSFADVQSTLLLHCEDTTSGWTYRTELCKETIAELFHGESADKPFQTRACAEVRGLVDEHWRHQIFEHGKALLLQRQAALGRRFAATSLDKTTFCKCRSGESTDDCNLRCGSSRL